MFQVDHYYPQPQRLVVESHVRLTVCKYSPGGDSFRLGSDNLLHDADGLNFPVDSCLVSLLRGRWSGIPSSLGSNISHPSGRGEVTMTCVRPSSSFDRLLTPPQLVSPVISIVDVQIFQPNKRGDYVR